MFMLQTLPGEELGLWDKLQGGSKPGCSFPRISVPPSTTCTALPQSSDPLLCSSMSGPIPALGPPLSSLKWLFPPENQRAVLPVKREVGDLHCAGAVVDGRGQPGHIASLADQNVAVIGHSKLPVDAVGTKLFTVLKRVLNLFRQQSPPKTVSLAAWPLGQSSLVFQNDLWLPYRFRRDPQGF